MILPNDIQHHETSVYVNHLLTPPSVLGGDVSDPYVIRQTEFTKFEELLEYRIEIKNLKLVPVKTQEMYDKYHKSDTGIWTEKVKDIIDENGIVLLDNEFTYDLPEDVSQKVVWISPNLNEDEIKEFISKAIHHLGLDKNEVILFERPKNVDMNLIKGSFPSIRHIHFWHKKK